MFTMIFWILEKQVKMLLNIDEVEKHSFGVNGTVMSK